ncbi:MAG TPA: hypothetical protein VHH90_00210 [Polyangia bacterium]|nr:hypothetical protein [Polyangia bacterium]
MFDRSERPSTRWIAWMPLLFVSAFLYWSVALGLGGLSLMATSALTGGCRARTWQMNAASIEPLPGRLSGEPIIVHLQESAEPSDEQDQDTVEPAEVDLTTDDGTGSLPGHAN